MSTQRIPSLPLNETTGQTRQILDDVNRTLNIVPNLYGVMAHSPATLQGYLALGRVREHGLLSKPLQERIALTVAQANQCDYCLSAHTALAKQVGLTEEQILRSREADASDPKTRAALQFARLMVVDRGNVSEA
ncbi:MAG: carboxymuconolactone decarboxylase family protein, partial [Bacteroidota bacterium]